MLVGGLFHRRELAVLEAGRADHERGAAVDAGAQVRVGRARQREVDGDMGAVERRAERSSVMARPARPRRRARPRRGRAACRSAPSPRPTSRRSSDSSTAAEHGPAHAPCGTEHRNLQHDQAPIRSKNSSRRRTTNARADYAGNPRSEATRRTCAAVRSARRSGSPASRPPRGRTGRRARRRAPASRPCRAAGTRVRTASRPEP